MNIILIHGSWHGGWCWNEVNTILSEKGHVVFAPTLSGMSGDGGDFGVTDHINDIISIINKNKLENIVLVGHSYAGMILRGVSFMIPEKILKTIYVDAFIPENGESLFDLLGAERKKEIIYNLKNDFLIPPLDASKFGVDKEMEKWLNNKLTYTPIKTFSEKIFGINENIESHYIFCSETPIMKKYRDKANIKGWNIYDIRSGHDVMIINPKKFSKILFEIIENHT